MKNFVNTLGIITLISFAFYSCAKEPVPQTDNTDNTEEAQEKTITRTVTVSQVTKTTIDGEGNLSWESGDWIYYYDYYEDGTASGKKSVTLEESGQHVSSERQRITEVLSSAGVSEEIISKL